MPPALRLTSLYRWWRRCVSQELHSVRHPDVHNSCKLRHHLVVPLLMGGAEGSGDVGFEALALHELHSLGRDGMRCGGGGCNGVALLIVMCGTGWGDGAVGRGWEEARSNTGKG